MEEEVVNTIRAYGQTFKRREGKLVLDDLVAAFYDRVNPEVEAELSEIPHPYREYVAKGQRDVITKIKAIIDMEIPSGDTETQD